ncbi:hypothetical protein Lser_V15G09700 [Lactuca serriola]
MPRRYVRKNNNTRPPPPPPPSEVNSAAFQTAVSAAVTAALAHIHNGNNGGGNGQGTGSSNHGMNHGATKACTYKYFSNAKPRIFNGTSGGNVITGNPETFDSAKCLAQKLYDHGNKKGTMTTETKAKKEGDKKKNSGKKGKGDSI